MFSLNKFNRTFVLSLSCSAVLLGCSTYDIQAVMKKPVYKDAVWGLYVVDMDTGQELISLAPGHKFLIASVRKLFTVGELLNKVGPAYRNNTPVYRTGQVSNGVLNGDLILVASGDLTMGGRSNPDGSVAFTGFDHNEADSLGNAVLTKPDPLAGYTQLAEQVARSGIKQIKGDVVIDDRLFQPYNFRNEFNLTPILVNDDLVDLTINPTTPGNPVSLVSRPLSSALTVSNMAVTGTAGSANTFELNPAPPAVVQCIGQVGCAASITGQLPIDFVPALTSQFPFVQAFRITQPSNYARTVFIEALAAAGVTVGATPVAVNPTQKLPAKNSYSNGNKVAELQGLPYSENGKLVMKVSYNIGSDINMLLLGLAHGVNNMDDALRVEQQNLADNYGISKDEYDFIDGSGGGNTRATNEAVVKFLLKMKESPEFATYLSMLPILAVDGSLGFVKDFQNDPTLTGATGKVFAKTGTYVTLFNANQVLSQALGGYITTKRGRHLAYQLVVNDVVISGINDVTGVFQDHGKISAILWRDY